MGALYGNFPPSWVITPEDLKAPFGDIAPGETKEFKYTITRDEQNATLLLWAMGDNTNTTDSLRVKVPINPLVILGVVGVMFGMAFFMNSKKQ